VLEQEGYPTDGWEGVLISDIPIGAGLSSSAALEMAAAKTFSVLGGWDFDPLKMARVGQRAENEWVGANTGIMDQTIVAAARPGHALMIDCRDLTLRQVPLPVDVSVVILDSATRHTHTDSGYNERRAQCEAAAAFFDVPYLRDVTLAAFHRRAAEMDPLPRRRARHVITENERVSQAAQALADGRVGVMGELMNTSHASMRDDFEITNAEIDLLVDLAQSERGCLGARMTGGGFGGSVVALVEHQAVETFAHSVQKKYGEGTGLNPAAYICTPAGAVEVVETNE
jgi:galactokinase